MSRSRPEPVDPGVLVVIGLVLAPAWGWWLGLAWRLFRSAAGW